MLALVISLAVSYFLYNRIKRQFAQSVQPLKIVAAAKAIDPGATISADDGDAGRLAGELPDCRARSRIPRTL